MPSGLGTGLRVLLHSKGRCLGALAGIAMAVAIMFVETGLLFAILDSQARIAQILRSDLVVMHRARTNLHKWNRLEGIRLEQIAAVEGVARVAPVYEGTVELRDRIDLRDRRIIVLAVRPDEIPFDLGDDADIGRELKLPDSVLFDRASRPIFGPIAPGDDVELDRRVHLRVAGLVDIGPDIVNDGALVMSEGTWLARFGADSPIMGAIRLKPGADRDEVRRRILARLPADVSVLSPAEIRDREYEFTLRVAPIGVLFAVAMLAGLVIGSVTCYQVLFNEVADHQRQYATLKAIGLSTAFLRRMILEQGLALSWLGFGAGIAVAAAVDHYVARATDLPLELTLDMSLMVLGLTMAMCILAGLLAVRRVAAADPAALY